MQTGFKISKRLAGIGIFVYASGISAWAQSPTTTLNFSINDISGSGFGIPGDQNSRGYGTLKFTLGSLTTSVYLNFVGIGGDGTTTKIIFIPRASTNDVIEFVDNSAAFDNNGRSGTAQVTWGTGAFHSAAGSFAYALVCGQGCPMPGQKPRYDDFTFHLKGSGTLTLPTATAQAVLPSLFPPPDTSNFFVRWINGKASMMQGTPLATTTGSQIRSTPKISGNASASGPQTFTVTPPAQIMPTNYQASATCANLPTGCWLSIPAPAGTISPFTSTPVTVEFDPGDIGTGVYPANIAITLTPSDGSGPPVTQSLGTTLVVTNGAPALQISENSVAFQAVTGARQTPLAHAISLSNTDGKPLAYQAAATTLSGGNWLSVAPASGAVSSASPGTATITADPSGLAPGSYFGRVEISAPDALTSLQSVVVELTVNQAGAAVPAFSTTGMIFVKQGSNPAPQTLNLSTLSAQPLTVTAGTEEDDSNPWLNVSASGTALSSSQPITQSVSMFTDGLAAGVHTGTIYETLSDGTPAYPISVALIVTPAGACTATQLVPVLTKLASTFEAPAAVPVSIQAQIVDDCGAPFAAGTVVASFSSGEPPVVMTALGNGQWSGIWVPQSLGGGPASVTVSAQAVSGLQGSTFANGTVDANAATTLVSPGGIVNAASLVLSEPISPGEFISIFGANLASAASSANSVPLPMELGGTQVLLGGEPLPLSYVGPNQINALIPYDIPVNGAQELLVQNKGVYALPAAVVVATANPAIFTQNGNGSGPGAVQVVKAGGVQFLNTPATPASAGDALVIYCTGLGAIAPDVDAGRSAPSSPLSQTVNPVSVTIGGQTVQPFFAGLAPGYAGLYQVNVIVPNGIAPGSAVPMRVTTQGFSSQPVTVSIQ